MQEIEVWKPVIGYEGRYEVSNYGRVKSLDYMHTGKEKLLRTYNDGDNHLYVVLNSKSHKKSQVYRLTYEAFIGPIPNGYFVHHINDNPLDNHISNLAICSPAEHNKLHNYNRDKNCKPCLQFDKNGAFIKEWNSITEAVLEYGYGIHDCVTGRAKTAYGFTWRYKF